MGRRNYVSVGLVIPLIMASPVVAARADAQTQVQLSAMPMADAIKAIARITGRTIQFAPDEVEGLRSAPVTHATGAEAALRSAIRRSPLSFETLADGTVQVSRDIEVFARRDEAETNILVRQTSTSDRNGLPLRDQPRNTEVLSAKLLQDQQANTVVDALRNAAGVSVDAGSSQGPASFTVRGFNSNGLSNGLPGFGASGLPTGAGQNVDNIERIEVLKGPDALLSGADNQGGVVNIVTKKPSAQRFLDVSTDVGSYGFAKLVLDGNGALTDNKKLSARLIVSADKADKTFGGYWGARNLLVAPSLRYKDEATDIVLSGSVTHDRTPLTALDYLNPDTLRPFNLPRDQPIPVADQYIRLRQNEFDLDVTRDLTSWLTFVLRGEHQTAKVDLDDYNVFFVLDGDGNALLSGNKSRFTATTNATDAFARLRFSTFGVKHRLNIGYSWQRVVSAQFTPSQNSDTFTYNLLTRTPTLPPREEADQQLNQLYSTQTGLYAQDFIDFGRVKILAGIRKTVIHNENNFYFDSSTQTRRFADVTPSTGAVFVINKNTSAFFNYMQGFYPNNAQAFGGALLPNNRTENKEGGFKLALFKENLNFTASYFNLTQSNVLLSDPAHFGFYIAGPGQIAKGIDLNAAGAIGRDLTVQGSYTRTEYRYQNSTFGAIVPGQPRDQYSAYGNYCFHHTTDTSASFSTGIFGRSSVPVDPQGLASVPASWQIDMNLIATYGNASLNFGVHNATNRKNYGVSSSDVFFPISAPRTWQLTLRYRFS